MWVGQGLRGLLVEAASGKSNSSELKRVWEGAEWVGLGNMEKKSVVSLQCFSCVPEDNKGKACSEGGAGSGEWRDEMTTQGSTTLPASVGHFRDKFFFFFLTHAVLGMELLALCMLGMLGKRSPLS